MIKLEKSSPHRMKWAVALSALAFAITLPGPALAQADGNSDNATKPPKLVVELEAVTKSIEDLRGKGTDSVGANGGNLEAAILSVQAIKAAALKLKASMKLDGKGQYLIAGQDEAINTDAYVIYQLEYKRLMRRLAEEQNNPGVRTKGAFAAGTTALLGLFSSLLRSETEVSELAGGLSDNRLLAHALAMAMDGDVQVFVPTTTRSIAADDPTIAELDTLINVRNQLARRLTSKNPDPGIKSVIDAVDGFISALYTRDSSGKIPVLTVIHSRRLAEALTGRTLVRVKIEISNGTLVKRKNLGTALGEPSLLASGGVIASYSIDSGNVTGKAGGVVICSTGLKNLRKIHRGATAAVSSDDIRNCSFQ